MSQRFETTPRTEQLPEKPVWTRSLAEAERVVEPRDSAAIVQTLARMRTDGEFAAPYDCDEAGFPRSNARFAPSTLTRDAGSPADWTKAIAELQRSRRQEYFDQIRRVVPNARPVFPSVVRQEIREQIVNVANVFARIFTRITEASISHRFAVRILGVRR